jgi:hypothetical protein
MLLNWGKVYSTVRYFHDITSFSHKDQFDSESGASTQPDLQAYLECYQAASVKLLRSVVASQAHAVSSRSLMSPDRRPGAGFSRPVAVFSPVVTSLRRDRSPQSVVSASSGSLLARLEEVDRKEFIAPVVNQIFIGR